MLYSALLLLLTSANGFHVRNVYFSDRVLHKYQLTGDHVIGARVIESSLSSTVTDAIRSSSSSSSALNGPSDDEINLNLIDGMGQEMMELIVEAASVKQKPKRVRDAISGTTS